LQEIGRERSQQHQAWREFESPGILM